MPSSREIKGQNEALNDQRDILDEISNLMEDASKTSEDLSKSLSGVADLFQHIKNDSAEVLFIKLFSGSPQLSFPN